MTGFRIFVVDDNTVFAEGGRRHLLLNPDNDVEAFATGKECLQQMYTRPHLIFLDYSLPDMTGIDVLRKIKASYPEVPVVVVSGQEDVSTAVKLLKEGAYDYIVKDQNAFERMWNAANNVKENHRLRGEIDRLREEVNLKYDFTSIKGSSPAIRKTFKLIERAVQTGITVSITGETGTGKELVAKAIHYNSRFGKSGPLVPVNIAAIPKDLMESELFGYEKGAFTGAVAKRIGKFEEAAGGTIFLDEIAELELNLQAKLLRVLQEKEVVRIGGNNKVKIGARIIVATHKNLAEEVKAGNFREDLYYRLLGLPIVLPPLRERGSDIIMLAKHFLEEFSRENRMAKPTISAGAQQKLMNHRWPGNVRELRAVMELAAVMCDNGNLSEENISFNSVDGGLTNLLVDELTLKAYNQMIIQHFLERYDGNVLEVAQKLDIGKSTIYRMIKNKELKN